MRKSIFYFLTFVSFLWDSNRIGVIASEYPFQGSAGETIIDLGHVGGIRDAILHPDGNSVFLACETAVKWFDLKTGTPIREFRGHSRDITSISISGDAQSLAALSAEKAILWNTQTGEQFQTLIPDRYWREATIRFTQDGSNILTAGEIVNGEFAVLWDAKTGEEIRSFQQPDQTTRRFSLYRFVTRNAIAIFSPDEKNILTGGYDQSMFPSLRIWDRQTGEIVRIWQQDELALSLAFSNDGKWILAGYENNDPPYYSDPPYYYEEPHLQATLLDVETGEELVSLTGHDMRVLSIDITPDKRYIVTGSSGDKPVKVWDAETGQEVIALQGHVDEVTMVQVTQNGELLLTASLDGTVRIWDFSRLIQDSGAKCFERYR